MENLKELVQTQSSLFLPLAIIVPVLCAVLLFVFSIKPAKEPSFNKLLEDRRPGPKNNKRKIKDKKTTANGHLVSMGDKSPAKEAKKSPAKDLVDKPKKPLDKKQRQDANNKQKSIEETKNKKNVKKAEKPVDFDDGNWETVVAKGDKKKKQDSSPIKKDRKIKKIPDKIDPMEIEKFVKEVVNAELRELEKEAIEEVAPAIKEAAIVVEETKEKKKKEKKPKKEPVLDNKDKEKEQEKVKEEPVKPQIVEEKAQIVEAVKETKAGVAFDELGDVWTEAKLPKKGKKKARRDN